MKGKGKTKLRLLFRWDGFIGRNNAASEDRQFTFVQMKEDIRPFPCPWIMADEDDQTCL